MQSGPALHHNVVGQVLKRLHVDPEHQLMEVAHSRTGAEVDAEGLAEYVET